MAQEIQREPTPLEQLARWWSKKYTLPSNHELFLSRTPFELFVEFYQDYYEQNPLEVHRNEDGYVQFKNTGDDLVDRWEAQLAAGQEPDLSEAFSSESWGKVQEVAKKKATRTFATGMTMKEVTDMIEKEQGDAKRLREADRPHSKYRKTTFG